MRLKKRYLRVCYIYQDQYPWDVRAEKIVNTLAGQGMEVHIVSRNRDGLPMREKASGNVYVHRLSGYGPKCLRDIINFPAFFSPFWLKKILDVVRRYSIDILIVRDLPLSPAAYIAARISGRPIIMDMAENYPAMIRGIWRYRGPKKLDYVIRNPICLKWLEKGVVPLMDGILVVSRFSAMRVREMRKSGKRTWVVGNTPIIHKEKPLSISLLAKEIRCRSNFILVYVGGLEESRGLDVGIKVIPHLLNFVPDILFVIVGEGTSKLKLSALAKELNIERHVFFAGWIRHEEIPSIIDSSDVCLIPHYVTEHIDSTLPNKLFDYMSQRKPVIVTQSKALSQIVKGVNCGVVYHDKSPESLCNAVRKVMDARTRETLGFNGWMAVQREFNWNNDMVHLLNAIYELAN